MVDRRLLNSTTKAMVDLRHSNTIRAINKDHRKGTSAMVSQTQVDRHNNNVRDL
jgi:hypothetical protein